MLEWQAILNNGEVIDSTEDIGLWRKLSQRCKQEGLTISSLKNRGLEIDEAADSYFIIQEAVVLSVYRDPENQRFRRGFGSIRRKNNKCRISWVCEQHKGGNYTEVIKGISDFYEEISIPVKKN